MTDNIETTIRTVLRHRGVETPCPACKGLGARMYSSGATWRGGMGVASMTYDVCDTCWGSGDKHRHGVNIRELEAKRADWEKEQCQRWLCSHLGLGLMGKELDVLLREFAAFAAKQGNRRKLPDGVSEFWWRHACEAFASLLLKLRREAKS